MATTIEDDISKNLKYEFFEALNNFTVGALASFNDADRTTTDLLLTMSNCRTYLSSSHYFQILISIKSICDRDLNRRQLTFNAIQNISYILEQFPIKPNRQTVYWFGLELDAVFDDCVKYLKNIVPNIIWICGNKPSYYRDVEWTFGKFSYYRHKANSVQPIAYEFGTVKHDTTVDKILEMITLSGSTSIQMRGHFNDVFKGPRLLWWAPDMSAYSEVGSPSFCHDESRYGSVRITVTLQQLLRLVQGDHGSKIYFYALGTRQYPRERCHSLMISREKSNDLVGWGDKYNEQNCDDNHGIIRRLNSNNINNTAEWNCYYTSDDTYDQLDLAVELGDNFLEFTPTSDLRISFVSHTRYCNRIRRKLVYTDSCYATKNGAMQMFVGELRKKNIQLADLESFFDNETFQELNSLNE